MEQSGETSTIASLFRNGGETGELMNSINWANTPLGPVETWPQNLRTCVRIILTSRQPMFVWWGPELINLYNDGYRSIVGGKHPVALGQPAAVVWKEIWDQVGPRADTVLRQNIGTYDESLLLIMERNGYPEETYYTFPYSPVPGDNDMTQGIICANTDDTERIVGERQLRTLKDLGNILVDVSSAEEVYNRSIQVIHENRQDFAFTFIYCIDEGSDTARLQASTEPDALPDIAPPAIVMGADNEAWPLAQVVQGCRHELLSCSSFPTGPLPTGAWDVEPSHILVLPVAQSSRAQPYAVMVIGMNPYRLADEKYLSFFRLVADQIATSIGIVRAYEEERRRAESLAELDRAKTAFFNNVSHEFRTPLTLMLGPLEDMVQHRGEGRSQQEQDNLEAAYRNARRLLKLVNTLLDFSRIEAGRLQVSFQPVDLATFTADIAGSFRSLMEKAGLKFSVQCEPGTERVYVDKEMWEKIVLNLLSNAFKYTLQGEVHLHLWHEKGKVLMQVQDSGVGIPSAELPHMFERFHRVANSGGRTFEGTGIGLSLVNELVKMHHGQIQVESELGKGTTFTVTVPAGKNHLPGDKIKEDIPAAGVNLSAADAYLTEALKWLGEGESGTEEIEKPALAGGKTYKVLLADDNADMREYIRRLLGDIYQVTTASNGRLALESIDAEMPDLVLSDVMMPEMDGFELVRRIKDNPRTTTLPVILLSARAGEEATVEGLATGADDYLVKPFSAKELVSRVNSALKLAEVRRYTEQQYRNLFSQAPVAIALLKGPDYVVESANTKMLEIWGREESIIGKPVLEALPEVADQGYPELLRHVYTSGEPFYGNELDIMLTHNGQLQHMYINFIYQPFREYNGQVSGILVLAYDVTEQVLNRRRVEESEAYFRRMADNVPAVIFVSLPDGSCSYLNLQWQEVTGQDTASAEGFGWLACIHPDDRERVKKHIAQASFVQAPFSLECRLYDWQKQERWMMMTGSPRYSAGTVFEGHVGSILDVTERKTYALALEQRVRERTAALQSINEQLKNQNEFTQTIIEASVDVIAVLDRDMRFTTVNKRWEDMYGYKKAEVLGRNIEEVFPQTKGSQNSQYIREALTGKHVHVEILRSVVVNHTFESYYIPLHKEDEVYGVLLLSHDLTRVLTAAEKLKKANEELKAKNQDLEQFAYVASHDMKEPLRMISSYTQLLLRELPAPTADMQDFSHYISEGVQRMQTLINDLLEYSRIGQMQTPFVPTDCNQVLRQVLNSLTIKIQETDTEVKVGKLPVISGVPSLIGQLFQNLIENAIKFRKTTETPRIEVNTAEEKDGYWLFSFKDNGIGINKQYENKIFVIFQRLHARSEYPGSGIGLAISKRIVEYHRGTIWVESKPGEGSTFCFRLPGVDV